MILSAAVVQFDPTSPSLFCYGTLRDDRLRRIVLGRALPAGRSFKARLTDHRLHRVRNADYPMLGPLAGASVAGIVITALTAGDLARLDFFEGGEYSRRVVTVVLQGEQLLRTLAYVPRSGLARDPRPWRYESWMRAERSGMLRQARVLMAAYRGQGQPAVRETS